MKKLAIFCFFLCFLCLTVLSAVILNHVADNVSPKRVEKKQPGKTKKVDKKNYQMLIHEVKPGETLEEISRRHIVNTWQVSRLDGSRPRSWHLLQLGERLVIKKIDWESEVVVASWYGPGFHGKKRADGKIYDMNKVSVAHKYLPLGTEIDVTNLKNQKTIRARVNDRGPYVKGRGIDLSYMAAKKLGAVKPGLIPVRIARAS